MWLGLDVSRSGVARVICIEIRDGQAVKKKLTAGQEEGLAQDKEQRGHPWHQQHPSL